MTGRRGFLALLLGSPIFAKEAVGELSNVGGSGFVSGSQEYGDQLADPWGNIPGGHEIMRALENELNLREGRSFQQIPPHIAERKSWSTVFKQSVAAKENQELRSLWQELHDLSASTSDPITMAMKANSLAKKMGVKISEIQSS